MSRFQQELSGQLGDFWKDRAEKELEYLKKQLEDNQITIDDNGVARNKIGRAVMSDLLEKLVCITDKVNVEATQAARDAELDESIAKYKANYKGPSEEEMVEMRAAFGAGSRIVNILTGDVVTV